jgi:hypothetical protein
MNPSLLILKFLGYQRTKVIQVAEERALGCGDVCVYWIIRFME